MRDLEARLDVWQRAGLISPEQADSVRSFEATEAATHPELPQSEPPQPEPMASSTTSLISEVLGYLGAVLAVSAIAVILGQTWNEMGTGARLAVAATVTVVFAAAGLALLRAANPPSQRLSGVMLAAAVVSATWLAEVTATRIFDADDNQAWLAMSLTATACAGLAYGLRRRGLAHITFLAATLSLVAAVVAKPVLHAEAGWVMLSLAAVGAAWVILGKRGWLPPTNVAQVSGGLVLLFGIFFAFQMDPSRGEWVWLLLLGVLIAMGLLAFATRGRGSLALIVPGALGLLVLLPQLIDVVFGDSLVTWFAVLVTGVGLVGLAVWLVRSRRLGKRDQVVAR